MRNVGREFQDLLCCLPTLQSLEVDLDAAFSSPVPQQPLRDPVLLDHLQELKVRTSRFHLLRLFTAPALRHFQYHATFELGQEGDLAQFIDIIAFKTSSRLEECLETLTIKITARLPLLSAGVGSIADRLSHLHTLHVDTGSATTYRLLCSYPIRVPSLTTARFNVGNEASAEAVIRITELYPAIRSVFVTALGVETVFDSPSAKAQGWSKLGASDYTLMR